MNPPATSSNTMVPGTDSAEPPLTEVPRWISVPDGEVSPNRIIAVIPAFNDVYMVGSVILQVRQHVDRIIVVDDGSSDQTAEVARSAGAEVIRLDQATSKAYALLLGLIR